MANFMPFVAIDVETSNVVVDGKIPDLLELCALFYDLGYHGGIKKKLRFYIEHKDYENLDWSPEAWEKNEALVGRIKNLQKEEEDSPLGQKSVVPPEEAARRLGDFLKECRELNDGRALAMAAKNAGNLVYPVVRSLGVGNELLSNRVLDVQSLYFTEFGFVPTFHLISDKTGGKTGSCEDDCEFMVQAVERKINMALGEPC